MFSLEDRLEIAFDRNDCQDEPRIDESTPAYKAGRLAHSIRGDVMKLVALTSEPGVKEALTDDSEDLASADYWLHEIWEWLRSRREAVL